MISAPGIGTGLDVDSIITQLMTLEQRPLQVLQSKQSEIQSKISAHGQLKSAVSVLQNAAQKLGDSSQFAGFTASSSDEDVFTASATTSASREAHSIEVIALAQSHRIASGTFADADTEVGTGTLTIGVGSESFDVTVDVDNNTLAGVRDAINEAADNPGVTASIINVDGGSRLILTSDDSGTANALTVTPDAGLSSLAFSDVDAAADAQIKVDGFTATRSSNTISDVIEGVTLNLQAAGSADLKIETETGSMTEAVEGLVNAYNFVRGNLRAMRNGALQGESFLLGIESRAREEFAKEANGLDGALSFMFQVGVSFDKEGEAKLDKAKLTEAIEADVNDVIDLFANEENGLGNRLDALFDNYLESGGIIDARTEGLEGQRRALDSRFESVEFRLEKTEQRYRDQFTALDGIVSQLQTTSSYLTQQLSNLPLANLNNSN